jgi:hypothetical protein
MPILENRFAALLAGARQPAAATPMEATKFLVAPFKPWPANWGGLSQLAVSNPLLGCRPTPIQPSLGLVNAANQRSDDPAGCG